MSSNTATVAAAPEVGQLVRVRDRHWVVTNVVASSLAETGPRLSHLVELSSVEDDAYRLLELNHQRYAEEIAQGLHEKRAPKGKARGTPAQGNRKGSSSPLREGV